MEDERLSILKDVLMIVLVGQGRVECRGDGKVSETDGRQTDVG